MGSRHHVRDSRPSAAATAHGQQPSPALKCRPWSRHRMIVFVEAADAAHLLSVRESWVNEAVRTGRLPCVRIGRHVRFTRATWRRSFESSASRGGWH